MIVASSRPRLSPSVHRNGNHMLDRASGRSIDLNDTARHIVYEIDGRRSVREIASGLSERFGVEERRALDDTTGLIDALYRGGLVRARPPWRYRLAYLVATLRTLHVSVFRGGVFARKRVDVRGGGFLAILAQVALHVCVRYWWLVAYLVLVGGSPFLLLGVGAAQTLLAPLVLCLVLLLGVSLHESAHLYVLRRRASDPWLGYLSFTSIKVGIRRPRIDRDELEHEVAVSGPLCPVICGVAMITLNAVVYPSFLLAASGMLLTVHALSLLPPSSDGKKLFFYAFARRQTEGYHER
jgi:Coenzyme PQQ synthesis protein D (PqqD)